MRLYRWTGTASMINTRFHWWIVIGPKTNPTTALTWDKNGKIEVYPTEAWPVMGSFSHASLTEGSQLWEQVCP